MLTFYLGVILSAMFCIIILANLHLNCQDDITEDWRELAERIKREADQDPL